MRKTALANLQHEIDLLINMSNQDTLIMDKHTLLFKIKGLIKYFKPQEIDDLVDAFDSNGETFADDGSMIKGIDWFNQTFEI